MLRHGQTFVEETDGIRRSLKLIPMQRHEFPRSVRKQTRCFH